MATPDSTRARLDEAMAARDPLAFELALTSAFEVGLSGDLAPLLARALLMPWHARHEDVARALQELRDPVAVDALFEAALAKHDYLEYDNCLGLARKCIWALADIGTVDAKRRLERLAASENKAISGYAQRRLDAWEHERERKGAR